MQAQARPLLLSLLGSLLFAGLAVAVLLIPRHEPKASPDDADDGQPDTVAGSATAPKFDAAFGSLAGLIGENGKVPAVTVSDAPTGKGVQHGAQYKELGWLEGQAAGAFTLQILAARDEAAVKSFIAGQGNPDQFSYFRGYDNGQPWYVVVYGVYGSREQAEGTAATLDIGLDSRPVAKAFSDYVEQIKSGEAAATSASGATSAP